MPELPEVETIRRDLEPELVGRRIDAVRIHHPDIVLPPTTPERFRRGVLGARIEALGRRGKTLILRLDRDHLVLVQLRMTGRFALGRDLPDPEAQLTHIAAEFRLDDGRTLFYDDVRRLGGFLLLRPDEWMERERRLGPEPLAHDFTAKRLAERLARSRAPVKSFLLDQGRLVGVGNIYASEALHAARLDPRRVARALEWPEVVRLHRAVRRVLRNALADAGTTFRDYRALDGRSGRFQSRLRVYGREGAPCRRCPGTVVRIVQAGRSTFFCPRCQR